MWRLLCQVERTRSPAGELHPLESSAFDGAHCLRRRSRTNFKSEIAILRQLQMALAGGGDLCSMADKLPGH